MSKSASQARRQMRLRAGGAPRGPMLLLDQIPGSQVLFHISGPPHGREIVLPEEGQSLAIERELQLRREHRLARLALPRAAHHGAVLVSRDGGTALYRWGNP
jgi:hypothetical protein